MKMPSIDNIVKNIKSLPKADEIGMILIHNGIVRKSAKYGNASVNGLVLSYDKHLLEEKVQELKKMSGIVEVFVFINEGNLNIGDDIMLVVVAGDRRSNILKPFEDFIEFIKQKIVKEQEV